MADEKVQKTTHRNVLESLLKNGATTREKVSSLNGDFGQAIADAEQKHNLHPAAFKMLAKIHKMAQTNPAKAAELVRCFDTYRDEVELDKLLVPDLPGMADGEKEPDQEHLH